MTRAQLRELNILGWIFCAAIFVVVVSQINSRTDLKDFVYFYSFGDILNKNAPEHLYDIGLQTETFQRVFPLKNGWYGPNAYPPWVAVFFKPFAALPLWTAYRLWVSISMALYLTGLLLLVRRFHPRDKLMQSILCCLGLVYWPFIARTLLNGHLSAIGFLAISVAVCLDDADREYLSGAALAICAYKPTLLLLILPMLLITRRKKILAGFSVGVALLIAATTLSEGLGVWPGYFHMTHEYARRQGLILYDYVDFLAFSTIISHGAAVVVWSSRACGLVAGALLVRIWHLSKIHPARITSTLVWGTTVTWTLILNVYVPQYDTVLAIVSIILTVSALKAFNSRATVAIIGGIIVSSYVTRQIAATTGVQVLSLFLIALGAIQMRLCFRSANSPLTVCEGSAAQVVFAGAAASH